MKELARLQGLREMDTAAFATWLGGIGLLDRGQRAEAFQELALAEADDPEQIPVIVDQARALIA